MKGYIIILNRLPAAAMAIFPFIFIHKKTIPAGDRLINHERIHLQQQFELLIFPFYIWYAIEYFIFRIKFSNHDKAYRAIRFEKEAYINDSDLNYFKKRKRYNYLF